MILHLLEDEKFVDAAVEQFESVAPGKSIYFVEVNQPNGEILYVKSRNKNVFFGKVGSEVFARITADLHQYNAVVAHNMYNTYKKKIIATAPENIYFHWMCWGADLYKHPLLEDNILGIREQMSIISSQPNLKGMLKKLIKQINPRLCYYFYNKYRPDYLDYFGLFKKIKSVSTVVPNEINLIHKYIGSHIKHLPFKYGSIDSVSVDNTVCCADNFLLGNSATITNNHLTAFKLLSQINLRNNFIYCPLSYGSGEYGSRISKMGSMEFGKKFIALDKFMPLNEYINVVRSCGNVVMAHKRQQGMGNIALSLWRGARLFLFKENPIYQFLKENKIRFFAITELYKYNELAPYAELAEYNRPILLKLYNKETILAETHNLYKSLSEHQP